MHHELYVLSLLSEHYSVYNECLLPNPLPSHLKLSHSLLYRRFMTSVFNVASFKCLRNTYKGCDVVKWRALDQEYIFLGSDIV